MSKSDSNQAASTQMTKMTSSVSEGLQFTLIRVEEITEC